MQRHTGFFKIVVAMTEVLCVTDMVWLFAGVLLVQRSRIARWLPPHERLRLPHLQTGQCQRGMRLLQVPLQGLSDVSLSGSLNV